MNDYSWYSSHQQSAKSPSIEGAASKEASVISRLPQGMHYSGTSDVFTLHQ